jgi:hypothetical protein
MPRHFSYSPNVLTNRFVPNQTVWHKEFLRSQHAGTMPSLTEQSHISLSWTGRARDSTIRAYCLPPCRAMPYCVRSSSLTSVACRSRQGRRNDDNCTRSGIGNIRHHLCGKHEAPHKQQKQIHSQAHKAPREDIVKPFHDTSSSNKCLSLSHTGTIPVYLTRHPLRNSTVRFSLQFVFNSTRRVNRPGLDWGTRNHSGISRVPFGGMVTGKPAVVTQEQFIVPP